MAASVIDHTHHTAHPADAVLPPDSPWRGASVERETGRAVAYNMIRCRQARRWSMRKVALALGVSPQRVAELELCRTLPTLAETVRLAGLFAVTLERMLMPLASPPRPAQSFLDAPNPSAPEFCDGLTDKDERELIFDCPDMPDLDRLIATQWRG
ncbi:helix-turn-helix transcriptional regulator [Fodinicurvata sp. EGI_FJ10296]|uniref:helix-turn-helix transcriptional regulator n=1 Tax=Fodinicurvata sp. EGI_FJ10296 TaxID=3231908 RepID=UPI0034559F9C